MSRFIIKGGRGEILVDRVRKKVSPLKAMTDDWLEVMDVAHRLGLSTSATMMFGHVETIEDRIEHLERVRAQQDKSLKQVPLGQTPISRQELAEKIMADALPVRFQVQLHKLIWPPDQRGV